MKIEIEPTRTIRILGLDERSIENLFWCSLSYGLDRLFWADEYLLCLEVYEKALEYEISKGVFSISQLCYAKFPKYEKMCEVESGYKMPVVNMSDVALYKEIAKAIKDNAGKQKP
jgi:hypothetical protein